MARRRKARPQHEGPLRAVTYRRVSTREQGDSGLGLNAQTSIMKTAIESKGWTHVGDFHDVSTGKTRKGRAGLEGALAMLEAGDADVLLVSKLDRLCRSLTDFGAINADAVEQGWAVKILDPDLDTSTANGRMCANMFAVLGEWEAELISQRTREGLQERRRQGHRLGPKPEIDPKVEERILTLYKPGATLSGIAETLNRDGVPTARGGRWHATTVRKVVDRAGVLRPPPSDVKIRNPKDRRRR